jgi:hypothetical protein
VAKPNGNREQWANQRCAAQNWRPECTTEKCTEKSSPGNGFGGRKLKSKAGNPDRRSASAEIKASSKNREGRPERALERMTRQSQSRRGSVDRSTLLRVGGRTKMHRDSRRRARCRAREESREEKHEPALELNEKEPMREKFEQENKINRASDLNGEKLQGHSEIE